MNGPQFLFQSNQFDVDQMSCHCFKVPIAPDPSSSKFTVVTLKCRQLLFELAGVVAASPNIDNNSVTVIGHTSVFSQEKFKAVVDKLKLTFDWQQTITNGIMADCFSYTLKARIAPLWNKAGDWLLAGRQFLQNANHIKAVQMKLHVADNRVEVVLKASYVSFPLLKPEDIGVTQETVDEFMRADDDAVITNSTFGNQYVVVLPRLSKARLISVTKKPQADSKMSEWSGMKRYWKNMYGYRLDTEDGSQPVVYYNVSFYNNNTLTYPEWTVRKHDPRPVARSDPRPIIETFLSELVSSNKTVCGVKFSMSPVPINIDSNLQSSSSSHNSSVGWNNNSKIPFRNYVSTPKDHIKVWDEKKQLSVKCDAVTVTSPIEKGDTASINKPEIVNKMLTVSDDSGYGTCDNASSNNNTQNQSSNKIKPTFLSKLLFKNPGLPGNNVAGKSKPEPSKPDFLSRILNNSRSSELYVPDNTSAKSENPMSGKHLTCPSFTTKSNKRPITKLEAADKTTCKSIKLSSAGVSSVPSPGPSPAPVQSKKRPAVVPVNIEQLIVKGKINEVNKLNVATLLDCCRKAGIKEAKSKSKKDELLRLLYSKYNSLTTNEP